MLNAKSKTCALKKRTWTTPKRLPRLAPNEIHVWLASLTVEKNKLKNLWNVLTAAEKEKTNQFKFSKLKKRFIVSQGMLRFLLGKYLKSAPQSIIFERNKYGKPYIKNSATKIKFNLSHAHNLVLFAFTLKHEVGVDIELVRRNFPIDEISKRFFHPAESKTLSALPKTRRATAFFNCWVKKEAFIKAIGLGLFYALDKFNVDFGVNQSILQVKNLNQPTSWLIQKLPVPTRYMAAIASKNKNAKIRFLRCS